MKVLFVASECAPFAKTGGLGDVVGSLPVFLKNLSHDVRIVMPLYSFIDKGKYVIVESSKQMSVQMGREVISCRVYKSKIAEDIPVYFIDCQQFFGRSGIYHDHNFKDYPDNPKRYSFLSMAALQLCRELVFQPDIIHAHDWHTAILAAYLKRTVKDDPLFSGTASVLTIHNLAYQGRYPWYFWEFTGLSWDDFKADRFEYYKDINFLKGGIYFADMVNTVSQGYADETRTPEGGFGLDYFLNRKGPDYTGILNGVDYSHWDPARDPLIPTQYSPLHLDWKIKL